MTDQEALARGVALVPELRNSISDGTPWPLLRNGHVSDIIAALEAAERIAKPAMLGGDGMVMVPREPTQEMLDIVTAADQHPPWNDKEMREVYQAMIDAAPAPASNGEAGVEMVARAIYGTRWGAWRTNWEAHWDDRDFDKGDKDMAFKEARAALAAIKPDAKAPGD